MELKQVFTNDDEEDDTHFGQFNYCPFCGTLLSLNRKAANKDQPVPNASLYSLETHLQELWL